MYDLKGEDKFLDFIFHDPTETYLNRVRSLLPMDDNDDTRELIRKHLHNYVYDHLLTYDYKTLESLKSIRLSLDLSYHVCINAIKLSMHNYLKT